MYYYIQVPQMRCLKWLIGQAVKTSPSHGENRGSIPLSAAYEKLIYQIGKWAFFVLFEMKKCNLYPPESDICYRFKIRVLFLVLKMDFQMHEFKEEE